MAIINAGATFVVKERVEALESKLDSILDAKGLQEFSRSHAETALQSTVGDAKKTLEKNLDSSLATLEEKRIEIETESEATRKEIYQNYQDVLVKINKETDKSRKNLKIMTAISVAVFLAQLILLNFTI